MRKQYLCLTAYTCDQCRGPVVSGSLVVRETEISKETNIRQVGALCLACNHRQIDVTEPGVTRYFPPVEWEVLPLIDPSRLASAFEDMLARAADVLPHA